MAELLRELDKQSVVPGGTRRFDLNHRCGVPTLKGNTQGNIGESIGGLASNRICRAGKLGLIHRTFANEVRPSPAGIAGFQSQIPWQQNLQPEALLLPHRGLEARVKDGG